MGGTRKIAAILVADIVGCLAQRIHIIDGMRKAGIPEG